MRPLLVVALLVASPLALGASPFPAHEPDARTLGSFTCDFGLASNISPTDIAPAIERDRMYMAARPGMLHKHIPVVPDPASGTLLSGGRYLFDSPADAGAYLDWVVRDFALDGTLFLQRAYFLHPDCHAWTVLRSDESGDFRQQTALRTERWTTTGHAADTLEHAWPRIRAQARERGYTAVWAIANDTDRLASLVYFAPRSATSLVGADVVAFASLKDAPPLGAPLDATTGWAKVMDRTQFTLTVWLPFARGDHGEPSAWPSSPPFPEPTPGDGMCEPSRGENASNSLGDCGPTCGNGVADEGETTRNCPSDVRPWG